MRLQPGHDPALSVTFPRRAGARPMMAFMVVDLPAPLRPSKAMVSPCCRTERPTPNSIWLVPYFWHKVRYADMDARRYANAQGLTMKGPRRIYNAFYSSAGMLFAQRNGLFRPYHDTVFRRFWSHDLEIDELPQISGVMPDIGGSAKDFETYVNGPARAEHDRIIGEAEALGVFGVPTMVFNDELFWGGDRIELLIERIKNPETIAAALGSRHRK
jgi:predicted DsbA family dithiol-disulfide isomerase